MHKASNALSVLQATAAIVGLAIILWSFGLPSLRFAEAANVTNFRDTLSDSAPGVDADHTIVFTTPTGVANGSTITIDFSDGFTGTSTINATDIDVATTSDYSVADNCAGSEQIGATWNLSVLTLTFCSGDGGSIPANGTTTIEIGNHATFGGAGSADQINNPASTGSRQIPLTAGASDSGETRVAIVDTVQVTATVDTLFTFTVAGVTTGQTVNGTTTTGSTTPTLINFGKLSANVASTAAQDLTVVTNARNGFVVTVEADGMLDSANGADIDGFANGTYTASPTAWSAPTATPGSENTYGHWGITSNDTDYFALTQRYVSASTSPVAVFANSGPTTGSGAGVGTTRVGYTVQISALQEAAEDYNAVLTYIATPVF
ncbi:MAG: hypothetical protein RLZZ480_84 [Candidatus Parcubacteria bacterium]